MWVIFIASTAVIALFAAHVVRRVYKITSDIRDDIEERSEKHRKEFDEQHKK